MQFWASGASTETSKAPSTPPKTRGKNCKRFLNESSVKANSQNPPESRAPSSWHQEEFRPEGRNVIFLQFDFWFPIFYSPLILTNLAATCHWDRRHVLGTRKIWAGRTICKWPYYCHPMPGSKKSCGVYVTKILPSDKALKTSRWSQMKFCVRDFGNVMNFLNEMGSM